MLTNDCYYAYVEGEFRKQSLFDLVKYSRAQDSCPHVWSARLSTGLFGQTNCASGNRGPKGYSEVILALGDAGLRELVALGFITCPVCRPENTEGFWDTVRPIVELKYGLTSLDDFVSKEILPFDARAVDWESILPVIGAVPNRFYVPRGLSDFDFRGFRNRINRIGFDLPPTGYYDPDSPDRFTAYLL